MHTSQMQRYNIVPEPLDDPCGHLERDESNLVEVYDWLQSIPNPAKPNNHHHPSQVKKKKKSVKIVIDMNKDEFYDISSLTCTSVPHNAATWDLMAAGMRFALQCRTLYSCDSFLGEHKAHGVYDELLKMEKLGIFEAGRQPSGSYACVTLSEPGQPHRLLDGLVLMVYKLAQYFSKRWAHPKVNVLHFPRGMAPSRAYSSLPNVLNCLYFCTPLVHLSETCGTLCLGHASGERSQYKFDRLLAFWDCGGATLSQITQEVFLVEIRLTLT
jgi:hypothetical protein